MKNRERTGLRRGINRRQFLAAAAAGWAGVQVLPARVLGRDGTTGPGGRITVGVIGTGSRGTDHARSLLGDGDVQLIAVCDANRSHAEKLRKAAEDRYAAEAGKGSWKGCLVTRDFREVLGRDDLDAVFIAAPESWHAIMSIEAMKAGKDVYCEKALALTVAEGRAVCDAVRRYGRVFQAGTQQRSDPRFRFACELARNGHLGSLKTVTVGVPGGRALPVLPVAPVPADLDYDLWLGPAPFKPYREGLCSYNWYFVTDYCAGWIQSWGVHHVDIALWGAPALATATLEVEGTATFPEEGTGDASYAWDTRCVTREGLTLHFCSDDRSPFGHGCRFEGERGWVHVDRGRLFAEPASLLETVSQVKKCDLAGSQKPVLDLALETTRAMGDPARARARFCAPCRGSGVRRRWRCSAGTSDRPMPRSARPLSARWRNGRTRQPWSRCSARRPRPPALRGLLRLAGDGEGAVDWFERTRPLLQTTADRREWLGALAGQRTMARPPPPAPWRSTSKGWWSPFPASRPTAPTRLVSRGGTTMATAGRNRCGSASAGSWTRRRCRPGAESARRRPP